MTSLSLFCRVNKPYLPIAAGDLSVQSAWLLVIFFAVAGVLIVGLNFGPFITSLYCLGLFLGTIYSVPPLRFKRFPVVAFLIIATVWFPIFPPFLFQKLNLCCVCHLLHGCFKLVENRRSNDVWKTKQPSKSDHDLCHKIGNKGKVGDFCSMLLYEHEMGKSWVNETIPPVDKKNNSLNKLGKQMIIVLVHL